MEEFSIKSSVKKNEYFKIMLFKLYRKFTFILIALVGFYIVITYKSFLDFLLGFMLILSPFVIALMAIIQFGSSLEKELKYTFTEKGIKVEGLTFKSEFDWNHIIKQIEVIDFLILYHSKNMGFFIDKRKLSLDQLKFLKDNLKFNR